MKDNSLWNYEKYLWWILVIQIVNHSVVHLVYPIIGAHTNNMNSFWRRVNTPMNSLNRQTPL